MTGKVIELISDTVISNINFVMIYILAITVAIIVLIISRRNKHAKYRTWKKESVNLIVWKKEWEANPDELFREIWDENQRLEAEVNVMKKKYTNLSIKLFVLAVLSIIVLYFASLVKKDK